MVKKIVLIYFIILQGIFFSQIRKPKPIVKDTLSSEAFSLMIEQTLASFYSEYANQTNYDKIIDELEYSGNQIPEFTDDEICNHLKKMNELSHFQLDCNPITLSTIRFFQKNRRSFIRIALGRSKLYFDLYEQTLDKYNLPTDLRFLSVIESGLRPQVKSPAGALGLWQFMYSTGKMYGLKENSHFDERMDPIKSTDAACRYLKKLNEIYGDWNLALAAYNAGPGNVNKAIRRSGGKKTYWEVRPFLPRETQGYVPNFIAAAYLMSFHAEHNLVPMESTFHFTQMDTMCLRLGVHFETITSLIDWDTDEIKQLNPVYKRNYIPETSPSQCINGPLLKIGKLVSLEDSLYAFEKKKFGSFSETPSQFILPLVTSQNDTTSNAENEIFIYHKVRKGETLAKIAKKYQVTNKQIIDWNKLKSTKVPAGKLLKILQNVIQESKNESLEKGKPIKNSTSDSVKTLIYYDTIVIIYHLVQRNETLESIANLYRVTKNDLLTWNNLSDNILNLDQRLKIQTKIQLSKTEMKASKNTVNVPIVETKKEVKTKPVKATYTIKSGDLFNRIAQKNGLTVQQLQKLNPNVNPDRISVGQKLRIR
jgi:membrane-bound lytic murein transglycosylase D